MAELGCGTTMMKYILFLFNIIFFIAGAAILGVSLWLKLDPTAKTGGFVVDSPLFDAALYTLIAVGAFIFLVGFLGCCGACCESSCMLCLYGGLLGLIFILQVAAAIVAIVYRGKYTDTELQKTMYEQVHTKLVQDNKDILMISWNSMQHELKCCGAKSFTDYTGSKYANKGPLPFPPTCCVMGSFNSEDPKAKDYETCKKEFNDPSLPVLNLYRSGCYDELKTWVEDHTVILIGIGFGVAALEIFCIIFACCVRSQINDW